MLCPACSCETSGGLEACETCGQSLESTCLACKRSIPSDYKFCGHCGAAQLGSAAVPDWMKSGRDANPKPEEAERRQLTVLFSDLVGSTVLSERLDPEDVRDAMRVYYALCADVVARFGGEIAELAGDGVVVYFGHPRAYEDAAERAVRAGIALTLAIGQIRVASPSMQVRIGIATGVMVVGDNIEVGTVREREIVGTPVNFAARLQTLAAPNTVVISALTRNLAGDTFTYEELSENDLKGLSTNIQVFTVVGENFTADRFEAHVGASLPPMTSRTSERTLLQDRWRRVKEGRGQVCSVSGEPGIGKSRLVHDLREQLSVEDHKFIAYVGTPLHQHTPLYPVAYQLRLATGIKPEDSMEQRRAKLAAWLELSSNDCSDMLSLLTALVESPHDLEDLRSDHPLGDYKEQLLSVLVEMPDIFAQCHPVLLVFEDVQWFDATTREFLDRLVRRIEALPILLVVTFRTGVSLPWQGLPHVTDLILTPLDPKSCLGVIKGVLGNRDLPVGVAEKIAGRTDGVPLFIEELTKAVLESQDKGGPLETPELRAVPGTLRDALMARLDRHQGARLISQIAAAIGREFPYELLAMVAPMPAAELHDALSELLQSELIFQHGLPPRSTYVFKHALVQEIAYSTQLRRQRRAVHRQIAGTLNKHFLDTPPEVVGYHYAQAGASSQAVAEYERAAEIARTRSANADAVAHFKRALELLETLPMSPERDRRERNLQIAYGAQLVAVKGNAASEVEGAYNRAMVLSKGENENRQIFRVLRGLQTFYMVRGELSKARPIGERLINEAEQADDPDLLLQAHRPHGLCLLYMGELTASREHLERAVSLYDPSKHAQHRFTYGSDPAVLAHCNLAWVEWFLGYPDRANRHEQVAIEISERSEPHPHSRVFALSFAASLNQFREEPDQAQRHAETILELAGRHQFAYWGPWGHVIHGWAHVMMSGGPSGIEEVRAGIDAYRATGANLMCPYFLGLQAAALNCVERNEEGLAAVNEALELSKSGHIRFYEPELYRVKAQLLRGVGAPVDERVACLSQAATKARSQGSRFLELRALTALGRELTNLTELALAMERVRDVLSGLTEGHVDKATIEAQEFLDSATF